MKRVYVGGVIMGRAPEDMKHPRVARERYRTSLCTIGQDKLSGKQAFWPASGQKKRTVQTFFASMRNIANAHQRTESHLLLLAPAAKNKNAPY